MSVHRRSRNGKGESQVPVDRLSPSFAHRLLAWYEHNKRDLPWRQNRDPYRVWLSEIMLQQTRVVAVLEHYRRFLTRFPNVKRLAAARESSVLAAWSGLGYYRRARMLHAAAKVVVRDYGETFPQSSEELRKLPGIGRYTAAAIASIAFGEPVAVVDGNVERVLQRIAGRKLQPAEIWQTAQNHLDPKRPGDYNQALMELGAVICVPAQPRCLLCPVSASCASRGELPEAEAKSRQRKQAIALGLARNNGDVLLVQRANDESLMPGMWELPALPGAGPATKLLLSVRHSITVTDYSVTVFEVQHMREIAGKWIPASRLKSIPLTGLARKILRRVALI